MQLLLIPLTIVIIGTIFQFSENRTDREIGKERVQQETLNSYLDSMGTLIVNGGLDQPQTVQVMRARTAATIRVLANVDHRNAVFGFLRDADLIGRRMAQDGNDDTQPNCPKPVALLERIVLMAADLRRASLRGVNLAEAFLYEASLTAASLTVANLRDADLRGATVTNQQLAQGSFPVGATLPEGTVIEDEEQWQAFKAKYGGSE